MINKSIIIFLLILSFFLIGNANTQQYDDSLQTTEDEISNQQTIPINTENDNNLNSQENVNNQEFDDRLKTLEIFVTTALVVLGILLAVNIITGTSNVKEAKTDLIKINDQINKYDSLLKDYEIENAKILEEINASFNDKIKELKIESKKLLERYISSEFENYLALKKKKELIDMLDEEKPDMRRVFHKLTDIISYPDQISLQIFSKALLKFESDKDITRIISRGLEIYRKRTDEIRRVMHHVNN